MTKQFSTKKALFASLITLMLSVSMLIGSTFAWFTDIATSGNIVIESGTIDVVLEYWDGDSWEDAEGQDLQFIKKEGYENQSVLWEPGSKYQLPKVRVRNEGSLTAYFVLRLNGITGDEKLLEAITLTTTISNIPESMKTGSQANLYAPMEGETFEPFYKAPDGNVLMDWTLAAKDVVTPNSGNTDTSAEFTIAGAMDETAGNEYQGLKLDGISIQVVATQAVYEFDSDDRYYDEDAELPKLITTIEEAEKALAAAKPGAVIALDLIEGEVVIPENATDITVVVTGNTIDKITLADGATDITISGGGIAATNSGDVLIKLNGDHGVLTLQNMKLSGIENVKAGHAVSGGNGTELIVDNCVISNIGYGIQDTFSGYETLTVKNSTFENTVSWAILNQGPTTSVTIDNCTFMNCQAGILKTTGMQANGTLVFTNNTMIGCKEHNPYGLIQLGNQDTCAITWFGNTFDGAEMVNPF